MRFKLKNGVVKRGAEVCAFVLYQAGPLFKVTSDKPEMFKGKLSEYFLNEICVKRFARYAYF